MNTPPPASKPKQKPVSVHIAAARLGCSGRTVRRLCRLGVLESEQRVLRGSHHVYLPERA